MIVGIGCDILEISRMQRELGENGPEFVARIFTPLEISYCQSKRYPERHFAARFAAKEAFFKAICNGWLHTIPWTEIEVVNESTGKPNLHLKGEAKLVSEMRGVKKVYISLAHTSQWATANVVLES
jgi:holo-[acyl-carrier protein] synthase